MAERKPKPDEHADAKPGERNLQAARRSVVADAAPRDDEPRHDREREQGNARNQQHAFGVKQSASEQRGTRTECAAQACGGAFVLQRGLRAQHGTDLQQHAGNGEQEKADGVGVQRADQLRMPARGEHRFARDQEQHGGEQAEERRGEQERQRDAAGRHAVEMQACAHVQRLPCPAGMGPMRITQSGVPQVSTVQGMFCCCKCG